MKRVILAPGIVIPVAAIAALLGAGVSRSAPEAAVPDGQPAVFGCGGVCLPCGFDWFAGEPIEPDGNYSHVHYDCDLTGNNCLCAGASVDPATTERAAALVATGAVEDLVAALRDYPTAVHLNLERRAVQVEGCNGNVVAQAPLPGGVVASLMSEFGV